MSLLAQMSWPQWFIAATLIGVCFFLMLVILLQRGRGGGLAGAFGGGGGASAFGAKTGDVFTWITVVVAAVFLILSVMANYGFDESAPARASTVDLVETTAPPVLPDDPVLPGATAPGQDDSVGQSTGSDFGSNADQGSP